MNDKTWLLSFYFIVTFPFYLIGQEFFVNLNQQVEQHELWFVSDNAPQNLIQDLYRIDASNNYRYKILNNNGNYIALCLNSKKLYYFDNFWRNLNVQNEVTFIYDDIFNYQSQLICIAHIKNSEIKNAVFILNSIKQKWEKVIANKNVPLNQSDKTESIHLFVSNSDDSYNIVQFRNNKSHFIPVNQKFNFKHDDFLKIQQLNYFMAISKDREMSYFLKTDVFQLKSIPYSEEVSDIINSAYIYINSEMLFYENRQSQNASIALDNSIIEQKEVKEPNSENSTIYYLLTGILIGIIGLGLLYIILKKYTYKKVSNHTKPQQKSEIEIEYQRIVIKLLEQQGRVLDTNALDAIFKIDHLNYETKRGRRAKLIKEVNTYTQLEYKLNIINRKKNEEDKRYYDYLIKSINKKV